MHSATAAPVSPRSLANAVPGSPETAIFDAPGKSTLHRRFRSGPLTTPAPSPHSAPYGAMACCDGDAPVCTIQPTACVDNYLHPASVLCTGDCPNDDMTLKCTADINAQCKLAHAATPIVYLQKPSYRDGRTRQRADSSPRRLASLNQVVRGWYCGQLVPNTDPVSQYLEVSTSGQVPTTTDSGPFQISSDEVAATKTHGAAYHEETIQSEEAPRPNSQPAASENDPSSPAQLPPVDTSQSQTSFPGNENCDWVNEYGECCDPLEGGYYRRKRRQVQDLQSNEDGMEEASNSTVSKIQTITYTQSTAIISRPMTTFTPMEAPDMPIVEAIYVVSNAYENQTDVIAFQEATRSHSILLYSVAREQTTETGRPTHSHPPRAKAGSKSDPRAGMKAGIAIGAIVVVALVLFAFFYFRSRRKERRAALERDAQPGPTRGWGY